MFAFSRLIGFFASFTITFPYGLSVFGVFMVILQSGVFLGMGVGGMGRRGKKNH